MLYVTYLTPTLEFPFSRCDKMDYNALHPSTRMELAAILEKDPMTACTAEESELLWEKRHFLYMRAEVISVRLCLNV